jgi:hypothetical protein
MKAKYNWKELRKEWDTGKYADLTDFANKHNIPYMTLIHKRWKKIDKKQEIKAEEKAINLLAKRKAAILQRHLDIGDKIINRGMEAIKDGLVVTSDGEHDAYKGAIMAEIGSKIQAKVLFEDREQQATKIEITIVKPDGV